MGKKQLPIRYNAELSLGVMHHDPVTVLLLSRFFKDVTIITGRRQQWLEDLGFGDQTRVVELEPNREHMWWDIARTDQFAQLLKTLHTQKLLLYAPLAPPYKFNPLVYLMNSPTLANAYQNKRYFREEFAGLIRMPEHVMRSIERLEQAGTYDRLKQRFGAFVLQDEESSGSRATFMVKSKADYKKALEQLAKHSYGRTIVVSRFMEGIDASTQVCITKYGIFSSGIQRQLVGCPELCNCELSGVAKWCGGELGMPFSEYAQHQVDEIAAVVGAELANRGYKGIFGIDLLITPENEVYAIEINARMTAYSHVVSSLQLVQGKIPYMLLHALELARIDYEITDLEALPNIHNDKLPVSYLVMSNPLSKAFKLKQYIRPGVYKILPDRLEYIKKTYSLEHLADTYEVLMICIYNKGDMIPSGAPMLKIIKYGETMQGAGLGTEAKEILGLIKKQFELPE